MTGKEKVKGRLLEWRGETHKTMPSQPRGRAIEGKGEIPSPIHSGGKKGPYPDENHIPCREINRPRKEVVIDYSHHLRRGGGESIF